MAHKTRGQKRALRDLCALARTALDVCEMIAQGGEERTRWSGGRSAVA